ncbi:unnamed protein product, partial [Arctogadus glacialis]
MTFMCRCASSEARREYDSCPGPPDPCLPWVTVYCRVAYSMQGRPPQILNAT